ncbi:MAG TPA: hypothetical protein VIC03_07410, partial [Gemmatimonadaceae bacterium]
VTDDMSLGSTCLTPALLASTTNRLKLVKLGSEYNSSAQPQSFAPGKSARNCTLTPVFHTGFSYSSGP